MKLKLRNMRAAWLLAIPVTATAQDIARRPGQEFDYHKPFYIIWFGLGFLLLLALLSYFVTGSRSRDAASEDSFWKWGIFYFNQDDPVLFVEKRYGIGYTLNFGNQLSWAVLALIVLAAAAPILYAIWSIHDIFNQRNVIHSSR